MKSDSVRQSKRPVHRSGSRLPVVAGVVALGVLAGGLASFALLADRSAPTQRATTAPSPVIEPTDEAEVPAENPDAEPAQISLLEAPQRMLVVGPGASTLVRAKAGSCESADGAAEITFDEGKTWQPVAYGGVPPIAFRQISPQDSRGLEMAAVDEQCSPVTLSATDGGAYWSSQPSNTVPSLPEPATSTLAGPNGPIELPCTAIALTNKGAESIVLCDDSSVLLSQNSGEAWLPAVPIPGALAVGATTAGFIAAVENAQVCEGIHIQRVSVDGIGVPAACLADVDASAGAIALAGNDERVFLWAGDRFAVSADGGNSWG